MKVTTTGRVAGWMACLAVPLFAACSRQAPQAEHAGTAATPVVTELQRVDLVKGAGEGISQGQIAVVHYTGWLYDRDEPDHKGTQFDSSRTNGKPYRFQIGAGKVIRGWDEGVQGMQPGGQRRLIIPADLAYGQDGAGRGVIPPNSPLLFDIELLAIEDPPP
jgi:FKBP-type peptidyl-prolyl cis-trans isomerase FkpA